MSRTASSTTTGSLITSHYSFRRDIRPPAASTPASKEEEEEEETKRFPILRRINYQRGRSLLLLWRDASFVDRTMKAGPEVRWNYGTPTIATLINNSNRIIVLCEWIPDLGLESKVLYLYLYFSFQEDENGNNRKKFEDCLMCNNLLFRLKQDRNLIFNFHGPLWRTNCVHRSKVYGIIL